MRLKFLVPNNAWCFISGDAPIQLHNAPMFFEERGAALDAASDLGLEVLTNGETLCADAVGPTIRWWVGPVAVREVCEAFRRAGYVATAGTETAVVDVPAGFRGASFASVATAILSDLERATGKRFGLTASAAHRTTADFSRRGGL